MINEPFEDTNTNNDEPAHSILDAITYTQQNETLRTFDPHSAVLEHLQKLADRERNVLSGRYGLDDGKSLTLEQIGQKLNLTRERIRQIEKDALKKLRRLNVPENLRKGVDLIFQIIEDRGNIAQENQILASILATNNSAVAQQSVLFILNLTPQFNLLKDSPIYHQSWYLTGFDQNLMDKLSTQTVQILTGTGKPLVLDDLVKLLREQLNPGELENFTSEAIESYVSVSKQIGKNPYDEIGLSSWPQINPKDVGDKAFLILSHQGKPEHYSKITEMINKQGFDSRTAHKESVHNELIKDKRFVLVGRGIYALAEWGYKKGVVAEIISEILGKAGQPLSKEEIISEVLRQRVVKRNTIIVGLSNKNKFRKNAENKYLNVQ